MAELTTLARPYAKAAFDTARAANTLKDWSSSLSLLAAVSKTGPVKSVLGSPTLSAEQKADALISVCGDELHANAKNFVKVLASNKRLNLLSQISELFENLRAQQEKFSDVQLISAYPLDSNVENALVEKLKKVLLCDVSLNTEIDKSLLAGVVVRSGDTVIDASVRGRLNKLAETFGIRA